MISFEIVIAILNITYPTILRQVFLIQNLNFFSVRRGKGTRYHFILRVRVRARGKNAEKIEIFL